jgi:hypothetical protein
MILLMEYMYCYVVCDVSIRATEVCCQHSVLTPDKPWYGQIDIYL